MLLIPCCHPSSRHSVHPHYGLLTHARPPSAWCSMLYANPRCSGDRFPRSVHTLHSHYTALHVPCGLDLHCRCFCSATCPCVPCLTCFSRQLSDRESAKTDTPAPQPRASFFPHSVHVRSSPAHVFDPQRSKHNRIQNPPTSDGPSSVRPGVDLC